MLECGEDDGSDFKMSVCLNIANIRWKLNHGVGWYRQIWKNILAHRDVCDERHDDRCTLLG